MNLFHPTKYLISRWNKIFRIDTIIGFRRRKILAISGFYVNGNSLHTEKLRNRAVKVRKFV
jgi:hypothetical protein